MNPQQGSPSFTHTDLPVVGKRVLRLGVAGNYGLQTGDILHAAERGVGFWLWSPRFKKVTPALKEILSGHREEHVVAAIDMAYTAGSVRRGVDKALKMLGTDHLDLYLLGWLGRTSALSRGIVEALQRLKQEGVVRAVGASIHDRKRAGAEARGSVLDAVMIRYNAKHPGAEQDIFPHLDARHPRAMVISYTAASWRQLLKPLPGVEMPPWPEHRPACRTEPGASLEQATARSEEGAYRAICDRRATPPGTLRGEHGDAERKLVGALNLGERTPPPLTPELCYRFCLSSPHVSLTLTGPKDRAQLDQNLSALQQGPLTEEEDAWVREYGRQVKKRKKLPFM